MQQKMKYKQRWNFPNWKMSQLIKSHKRTDKKKYIFTIYEISQNMKLLKRWNVNKRKPKEKVNNIWNVTQREMSQRMKYPKRYTITKYVKSHNSMSQMIKTHIRMCHKRWDVIKDGNYKS